MADNVAISEGTGTNIAADDVGGVKYQRVKPAWGVDGSAVDTSATNPLPVVQTGTPALPTGAATEASLATVAALSKAEDAAHSSGDPGVMLLAVRQDTAAALAGTNGDYIPLIVDASGRLHVLSGNFPAAAALADAASNPTTALTGAALIGYNGATWDRVRVQSTRKDLSAVTITTITTVWTPASGKKFRLMGGSISVSAACSVLFEDNSAGAGNFVWRTPKLAADTPYNFDLGNGKLSAVADQLLKATSSAAATITGTLYGVEE